MNFIYKENKIHKMICKCCKTEKEEFYKNDKTCKECRSNQYKEKYLKNKEYYKEKSKKYNEENKEKVRESSREYYTENKEKIENYQKEYRENNKEKTKEYNKNYQEENKEELLIKRKEYLEKNKEKKKIYFHEYNKNNFEKRQKRRVERKEIIKEYNYNYKKNRYQNDELFRISCDIRRSISSSIRRRGYKKNSRTYEILGCTFMEFKLYIESKFETWMNWENRGKYNGEIEYGWDFDHIIPISTAESEEDIIRLNHYTNFQPLCSYINRYIKRDNINYNIEL